LPILLGDLAAPLRGRADVQLQIADLDAEIVEPGREPPGVIRRFEHRLGRDATPVVADAAQLLCLYARDLESELRRPDRGHVTPGPGTQNDDIEGIVRHTSPRGLNSAPWDRRPSYRARGLPTTTGPRRAAETAERATVVAGRRALPVQSDRRGCRRPARPAVAAAAELLRAIRRSSSSAPRGSS